jgi:superfamily I DNA/RNA helicase
MVDEAQDLSPLRQMFAYAMAGPRGRLVFVGDDRQAIYGFSGADTDSLTKIEQHLQAKRLYLTSTFRCGKAIVAKAKELVPDYEAAESNQRPRSWCPTTRQPRATIRAASSALKTGPRTWGRVMP